MFTKALYYPYILIPDNLWLRRAILYWDKINPIVPQEVEIPQNHISHELEKHGMLDLIRPEDCFDHYSLEWQKVREDFIELIRNLENSGILPPEERRNYEYCIHWHKFDYELMKELEPFHLYQRSGDWIYFERNAGKLYMSFLATNLANFLHLEPLTDSKDHQRDFLQAQLVGLNRSETFISLTLEQLLPAPKENVSVEEIIKFKEKHKGELLCFRRLIKDFINSLESVTDESQFLGRLNSVKDNIKEQSLILHRRLEENRIETVFNVLETAFTLSAPQIGAVIGATAISAPLGAVVFGVNAAIKIGKEIFRGHMRRNSILATNPYTYVFNVKEKLA